MTTFDYMLETLNYISLFQDLKPDQIAQLDPLFERTTFASNTTLFAQNQPATFLYILLKGEAVITYKPYDGPSITITHLQPGAVFGWSAVTGSENYTSSSNSISPVEVARVAKTDLWQFVQNNPETGEFLLNRIASSVSTRWADAHVQVQAMLDKGRLMRTGNVRRKEKMAAITNEKEVQLRGLLEKLSSYVEQFHGGTVEFVSFDGKAVRVRLGGACLNCPLLPSTLHGWVAGTIHQFFPDVDVVEDK